MIHHLAKRHKGTTIMLMFRCTTELCSAIVFAFLAACSSRDVTPGLAPCAASGCNPNTIVSSAGLGVGGAASGSDSGVLGLSMNVSVVEFDHGVSGANTWSTNAVQELSGTFTVNLPSTLGTVLTETGGSPLSFDNVLVSSQSWVTAAPAANSGYFSGMRSIPADNAGSVSVPLLRTSDLDFVPTLVSTQPLTVDTSKAQVVIKVVDINGAGVAGVRASDMGAAAMAYLSGNTWIDTTTNPPTDASGLIMAINLKCAKPAWWTRDGHHQWSHITSGATHRYWTNPGPGGLRLIRHGAVSVIAFFEETAQFRSLVLATVETVAVTGMVSTLAPVVNPKGFAGRKLGSLLQESPQSPLPLYLRNTLVTQLCVEQFIIGVSYCPLARSARARRLSNPCRVAVIGGVLRLRHADQAHVVEGDIVVCGTRTGVWFIHVPLNLE